MSRPRYDANASRWFSNNQGSTRYLGTKYPGGIPPTNSVEEVVLPELNLHVAGLANPPGATTSRTTQSVGACGDPAGHWYDMDRRPQERKARDRSPGRRISMRTVCHCPGGMTQTYIARYSHGLSLPGTHPVGMLLGAHLTCWMPSIRSEIVFIRLHHRKWITSCCCAE